MADAGLAEGRSADLGAAGSEDGTVEQAKEACLRLLAVRARSRAELARRLAAKGYSPEVSERALDRLGAVGLVDDAAFAEQWVHSRHTFSGKGKQALAQELRRKGVAQSDAVAALDAITTGDEETRAAELVRRKLRSLPPDLDQDKMIRRLVGMLARRGYGRSTAYRVVKAELADRGIEGDFDESID
ncbi:recombination regulator RecX [Nocardia sp. R7R-8]|uniref:recombination regulator RecX n=1 Tax=Nocardia sp. R7R-8 TaxID=3459304 RepID=UPI00403DF220